jgi:rRNA maturation RNase YbeY
MIFRLSIKFHYRKKNFKLNRTRELKKLIERIILDRKKIPGNIFYIITNDDEVLNINKEFLGHDYFTDVIAFDYSTKNVVHGEVFLSRDTIKENALNYKVSLKNEILRVIIHATLHLCGMKDGTEKEREGMRKEEDYWLRKMTEL